MADPAAELQRQLQLLAEQFRQRLQRDLPELSAQAEALGKATNEAARQPLLLAIRQQLHKLAGSAGTFGFAALGEQARRLEQQGSTWLCAGQCDGALLPEFIADLHQLSDLAGNGGQAGRRVAASRWRWPLKTAAHRSTSASSFLKKTR